MDIECWCGRLKFAMFDKKLDYISKKVGDKCIVSTKSK